ncbi:MAG: hypothetical protein RLZZ196_3160 [Bacteroidota bacterium]|jgi:hypothetical protein
MDVITNRKMLSVKLQVWKKLIACSNYEDITITKLIDKLITKYIEDNKYNIDQIFKDNLEVNTNIFREDKTIEIPYNFEDKHRATDL